MMKFRKALNDLSKKFNQQYGQFDGGFSFDHQISVADRVAMDVRWKRIDPVAIGDNRRQAHKDRFRFRLSATHDHIFDLYELVHYTLGVLKSSGFTPDLPSGDNESGERVEIDINATMD